MDGPGLSASVTTQEPVVTPTPIRSRPTAAVAAPMAATRRGIVWPQVITS